MPQIRSALLSALLATGCGVPLDEPSVTRQGAVAAPEGAGFIDKIDYMGTGCPPMSTSSPLSPDKQAVTTIFSAFVASKGGVSDPAKAALNCVVMMEVNVPAGWQYSIESLDYRGFAGLEGEVTATRQGLYLISGNPVQRAPKAQLKGGTFDDFTHSDVGPAAPGVWSPCGGGQVLWVATQLEVNNSARPTRTGSVHLDTIDTELQWRRCQ